MSPVSAMLKYQDSGRERAYQLVNTSAIIANEKVIVNGKVMKALKY